MTTGQKDILKFLYSNYPEIRAEIIGESIIRATNGNKTTDYTMNIFGDIMEVLPNGKNKIIAVSDLPHNLDKIQTTARPETWTPATPIKRG